jgi:phosphate transport system substrate-binding protein
MRTLSACLIIISLAVPCTLASEVKMLGSTTTFLSLVKDNKEAVASETKCTITATGATTGKGFAALQAGQVDIAMSTESIQGIVDIATAAGSVVNGDDYREFPLKPAYIVFVCHPSNLVSTLTEEQIRNIMSGKIKNWKEVGGADLPIALFSEREESGNHQLVKRHVLKTRPLPVRGLTYVDNSRLIVRNIADVDSSFGPTSDLYVTSSVKVIKGFRIEEHLCFITRKNPSPEVLSVIEAFLAKQK